MADKYGLVFELPAGLRKVYEGLGLNLPDYNGDESWTLPMPARFIIDRQGTIRYSETDPDYTSRPEPADTLKFLREMNS